MNPFGSECFFDLKDNAASDFLRSVKYVWDAVGMLASFIERIIEPGIHGEVEEGAWLEPGRVQLGEGSRIERGAIVRGPTIIGKDTVVRSGAYIRGHVMVGDGCLIGHGTELRQLLVLDNSNIPHLNCFFTSIVGNRVRIGGATHTANYRLDGKEVKTSVPVDGGMQSFSTGQRRFGCVIGDGSNIAGCVLVNAGTVVGRRCLVYPMCSISGYIPDDSLIKPATIPLETVLRVE
jgi:NDP-sugar pyrophosphorylase family protein